MSATALPHDIEPHPLTGMYNGKFGTWLFLASEVMLFGALFSTYVLLRVGAPSNDWPHPGAWPARGDLILNVWLAMGNTMVLITSSVTMVMAWASLKMHDIAKAKVYLIVTFLLAGGFLVVKYFEYSAKLHHYQVELIAPMTVHGEETTVITGHLAGNDSKFTVGVAPMEEDLVVITPDPPPGEHGKAEAHAAHGDPIRIEGDKIRRVTNFGPRHSPFLAIYFTLTGLHGLHIVGGMVVIGYLILTAGPMWQRMPEKLTNRVECTGLYWHFVDLVWIFLFPVLYLL